MTDGEGRSTWRTDRYSPCPRQEAGRYLAFLASLGYQLSDIEQAVASGSTWAGDTPPGDLIPAAPDEDASGQGAGASPGGEISVGGGTPGTPGRTSEETGGTA